MLSFDIFDSFADYRFIFDLLLAIAQHTSRFLAKTFSLKAIKSHLVTNL